MNATSRLILRGLTIVLAILALITILPYGAAKEDCLMAYKSVCPFAPVSTIISLYISLTIHRYLRIENRKA